MTAIDIDTIFILLIFIHASFGSQVGIQNSEIITFNAANMTLLNDPKTGLRHANFVKIQNKYLNVTSIRKLCVKKYGNCANECVGSGKCVAFNFAKLPTCNGGHECELLRVDKFSKPDKLNDSSDYNHFTLKTECMTSPCVNHGTCIPEYTTNTYRCVCLRGIKGDNCEVIPGPSAITMVPVGMEDKSILDSQITASSFFDSQHPPWYGRLNEDRGARVWASRERKAGDYLQIDLNTIMVVYKVATQGRPSQVQYSKSYFLQYSNDNLIWANYTVNGNEKVFPGNVDQNSVVSHVFSAPFLARYVRFVVLSWFNHPVLRVELYTCAQ